MPDNLTEPSPQLDPNEILIAEFEYISQTAFQANEDRARVSSYYFITAAAIVAAMIGVRLEGTVPPGIYFGFFIVFAILGFVGLLTVLQLARLRLAWAASARAMNQIKEYYESNCSDVELQHAFAWKTSSIPATDKPSSVAFLLSLSLILVDSLTMGTAVTYLGLASGASPGDVVWLIIAIIAGIIFAGIQYRLYFRAVRK